MASEHESAEDYARVMREGEARFGDKRLNIGTHAYVGTLECGCGVSLVRDMPGSERETARGVASMIRRGQRVQRLPHTEACAAFAAQCAAYPHEEWQRRYERDKDGA